MGPRVLLKGHSPKDKELYMLTRGSVPSTKTANTTKRGLFKRTQINKQTDASNCGLGKSSKQQPSTTTG